MLDYITGACSSAWEGNEQTPFLWLGEIHGMAPVLSAEKWVMAWGQRVSSEGRHPRFRRWSDLRSDPDIAKLGLVIQKLSVERRLM